MKAETKEEGEKKATTRAADTSAQFAGMKMVMKKRSDEDFIVMGGGKKKGRGTKKVRDVARGGRLLRV